MRKMKERERDIYRQELMKLREQEKAGAEQILLGQRAGNRRLTRRLNLERMEAEEEEAMEKDLMSRKCHLAKIELDEQMAKDLEARKDADFVELKLRQKIRENSDELKELESKLKTAYVNKELAVQMAEKEADRLAHKYREELDIKMIRKKWAEEEEAMKEDMRSEIERKAQYYKDLQSQEKYEEERRHEAYQDFLREKMMIDEIVRKLHEEDQRELEDMMIKKKKTKHEMDEFRRVQGIWKEKERVAMEQENRRIIEFLKQKEEMQLKESKAAKEREDIKAAVTQRLTKFIKEQQERQHCYEKVYQDLLEEEMRQRDEERAKKEIQERLWKQEELQIAEAWSRQERLRRLMEDAENEAQQRERMMEEFAAADKLEQLGEERKRKKKAEHRKAVESLLKEREKERERQMECLREEQRQDEEEQCLRRQAIETERLRMLKEHACKLLGYLPKGILREDDLPLLGGYARVLTRIRGNRFVRVTWYFLVRRVILLCSNRREGVVRSKSYSLPENR